MFDNNGFNGAENRNLVDARYPIQEFKQSTAFIQENWTDDLGVNFVRLLQNAEMELTRLEHRRVVLTENIKTLRDKMHEVINDNDGDEPPHKTRVLTPSGDNFSTGSGGRSRRR